AIRPIFKNFKAKRQRMQALLKNDKVSATSKERRLLRRLKRAPKRAKVPDLGRIYKIDLAPGQSAARAAAEYNKDPDVEYAELNYLVSIAVTEPNDPNYYPEQWALHNDGTAHPIPGGNTAAGTPDCDIDAPEAWDIQTGSTDVTVAVLDTGVDYGHNDLSANIWFNKVELNGDPNVDDDNNGYVDDIYGYDFCTFAQYRDSDPNDDHGHGTHCAGIIAADGNNGLDTSGINWDANVMALKFLSKWGYGWNEDAQEAIEYAVDMGADIISNSWGSIAFSQSLKETCDYAYSQGVFLVGAAGNNDDIWGIFPARYANMMSVAATDHNDIKADFSCYGDWIDVAAPGVDILSLRAKDGSGPMHSLYLAYPYNDANATMCIASGTSMACPHVAGLAALCLAEEPDLTIGDLWALIKNGCDDIDDPNDPNDGNYYGSGRINAYTTVNYISSIPGANKATSPLPANSATNVSANVHLSWTADDWAASHDVYFGTAFNDVNEANTSSSCFKGNQPGTVFDPNTLGANTTYYWRIDEKNYSGTTKGDVRTFTTGPDSVIYVDVDATGNNDGTSWANAFTDLQNALAKAFDADDIWVAEGTYKPHASDANVSFEPREGVSLYGGFDADETDPNQRDPNIYNCQTILSGDIGTAGDANDNSFHVVKLLGDNGNSVLFDRFKITGGNADRMPDFEAYGGAMFNFACSLTLKDCLLIDNYAIMYGGGIFNRCASATATNCTFTENKAYKGGGMGAYVGLSSGTSLTQCTFEKNDTGTNPLVSWQKGSGGGLYAYYDTVTVVDSTFVDNNSLGSNGAICVYGALEIRGSMIAANNSPGSYSSAGGIYCNGNLAMTDCNVIGNANHGMFIWSQDANISDCEFSENDGIGIFVSSSKGTIENCTFDKNIGPGIKCNMNCSGLTIRNCLFTHNANTSETNKIYHGGGISNSQYASCTISNCTFTKNAAVYGGAIYNYDCSPQISNCLLWDNSATTAGDEIYNWVSDPNTRSADPNISYSDIKGSGGSGGGWDPNLGTDCGGNIDQDPCFADADANDFHLSPDSPCINAGDPNADYSGQTDIDGDPRLMAATVDIGADEFSGIFNLDQEKWYDSIQDAIDDANENETIEVGPGTYYETVDFNAKAVTLRCVDPNDWRLVAVTIIDANDSGTVVLFESGEDGNSILDGFTVADGNGLYGGGIYCDASSPTIRNCVITDSYAVFGGGMEVDDASPTVTNCVFTSNTCFYDGAGICTDSASPTVTNCVFTDNTTEIGNGAGVANWWASPTIVNCTFTANYAGYQGGGIWNISASSTPLLENCIFWGNQAYGSGEEVYNYSSADPNFSYCCIEGGINGTKCGGDTSTDGGGNINADPNFADPNDPDGTDGIWATSDDGLLLTTTRCIDAANGNVDPATDILGQTRADDPNWSNIGIGDPNYVDMGAYERDPGS
ncbi:MAG: S8 family serine peptidase, partial [Planctomycetota bacterium]